MENLFSNNSFIVFIIAVLMYVSQGIAKNERMKIVVTYMITFLVAFLNNIPVWLACVGSIIILFATLEILSSDEKRLKIFNNLKTKIVDFLYRMFIEYYYGRFVVSMTLPYIPKILPECSEILSPISYIFSALLLLNTVIMVLSQKYSTRSITDIVRMMESKFNIETFRSNQLYGTQLMILAHMEDNNFFSRNERSHRPSSLQVLRKFFRYSVMLKFIKHPILTWKNFFRRGYGTLEMQLLRTIGVETGYDHRVRRKIFEIVYSNMFFNHYKIYLKNKQLSFGGPDFNEYIAQIYTENVSSSINNFYYNPMVITKDDRSSLQAFCDEYDYKKISKEYFFTWCLGLPHYRGGVWTNAIDMHADTVKEFNIDINKVYEILRSSPSKYPA